MAMALYWGTESSQRSAGTDYVPRPGAGPPQVHELRTRHRSLDSRSSSSNMARPTSMVCIKAKLEFHCTFTPVSLAPWLKLGTGFTRNLGCEKRRAGRKLARRIRLDSCPISFDLAQTRTKLR